MLRILIRRLKTFYWAIIRTEAHLARMAKIATVDHIDRLKAQYDNPLRLERHGFKVYSQGDEDGQIQEIFNRIGVTDRRFIEIGASDGSENCTAYLLHQGWGGSWIDGPSNEQLARENWPREMEKQQVKFIPARIEPHNINDVIKTSGVSGEIDLFVLDIDGNDYHVLEKLSVVRPRVICIEYNASFPPPYRWVMPYNSEHHYDGSNYYGASLSAFEALLRDRGYSLVGCSLSGANAFFVRSDLASGKFAEPLTAEHLYQPPRHYLVYMHHGMRYGFLTGRYPPQLFKQNLG